MWKTLAKFMQILVREPGLGPGQANANETHFISEKEHTVYIKGIVPINAYKMRMSREHSIETIQVCFI